MPDTPAGLKSCTALEIPPIPGALGTPLSKSQAAEALAEQRASAFEKDRCAKSWDGFYADFVTDPHILRVVALSGGYSRAEACAMLAKNPGVVASFSRALTQGLTATQTPAEFDEMLGKAIEEIFQASNA